MSNGFEKYPTMWMENMIRRRPIKRRVVKKKPRRTTQRYDHSKAECKPNFEQSERLREKFEVEW